MLQPKAVARFALVAIVAYALVTSLWFVRPFERAYGHFFRALGEAVFSQQFWFWPDARVRFLDAGSPDLRKNIERAVGGSLGEHIVPGEQGDKDTVLILMNRNVPNLPGFLRTSSRFMGFAPTAVLIALCVATPIAWRRRIWLLVWSLLFLHAFILIRLTILVLKGGLADPSKRNAFFHPNELWWDLLRRLDVILCDNPTFAYLVAVFFWLITLFLFEAWATLRGKPGLLGKQTS